MPAKMENGATRNFHGQKLMVIFWARGGERNGVGKYQERPHYPNGLLQCGPLENIFPLLHTVRNHKLKVLSNHTFTQGLAESWGKRPKKKQNQSSGVHTITIRLLCHYSDAQGHNKGHGRMHGSGTKAKR